LLAEHGADLHARDGNGMTPLAHAAGYYSYPELVGYLLKEGADVMAQDKVGRTPADETMRFGDSENCRKTREFLISHSKERWPRSRH
jgi:ankyrin repeat protein